jgi:MFS-type transporter involved in bile tolerance (Atg22 family)
VELAQGAVATQVAIYLSQFFVQLRDLVWSMIVCSVLLLLAATSYPFQPDRLILSLMVTLVGGVVAAVCYVLVQMNRDELLSRISGTTPNRFNLDTEFLGSFITYIVPALGVVTLQLTGAFRFLFEPILSGPFHK